ncbi:MAG: ATP-dependent Clp protease ATP-binding subunit ClpC [Candidatus Komeilibacteria bacterium CG11_big_fil_rev_8_21_14_0_20_36_20]|uniref:ATP-dependent Clp protease ATP-binding subunit ClpC n=1 Tax=Candidatus Komeilibacteria bacterium CG11_big_fil_rev_8_21_14_0_20_36_20 TaxID=1974477 RepID=A0A2H0ND70_9BACT|nr:MAG: ATP-dependent Clp protease ATP-binding subunit ClpC [Candidatus Komeilibacteria bacterium CG11_big_fil_rev_8_21_14_0_20_36_20]PIR81557.1 MAG: ATP-dependent Clp protease ATP-binding subunit ClpC [Candidatus Komeilibacteria bacterium CG10_big_fil_rev_8_21_14_0_10_36_65]PJC55395.1 MAG: ATP-dependent Clp protease ATP-binding subunit ClpC [Candidatus Komeilibacteria bacterium CG_4_9_14_0_2_um_filter_36_13]
MNHENTSNILNKFTYHFKKVLISAQNLALTKKHARIESDDVLLSLISAKGSLGSDILIKQNLNTEFLKTMDLAENYSTVDINLEELPQPSEEMQKIIEKAVITSYKFHHKYIGTEHLLWGILESDNKTVAEIFEKAKINIRSLKQHLSLILKSTSKFSDLTHHEDMKELENIFDENQPEASTIENFTINLTTKEIQKDIDPVIGRKKEIDRLIEILSRRTKNNPVLLGDAGVGKTAIIEGLAKRITENKVPDVLLNKKILNLDISSLLAGTMYRGEFESRLKQVINEVKNDPNCLLFIDELHTIMGAGATTGSLDAANILKPALARGDLRCIGATTFEEYKKHIESDKALERRFQPIIINEASEEETYEILQGIKSNYEKFHRVLITDAALQTAIKLSRRFLPDKKLPDKAIDLIDEAAARLKIRNTKESLTKIIKNLKDKIEVCANNKRQAVLDENFLEALKYKDQEEKFLEELLQLKAQDDKNKQSNLGNVDQQQIKEIISKITGVPISSVDENENKQLLHLEKNLTNHIFGQGKALGTIANTIRKSKTGLQDKNKPLASFMFLGPSGVGKTETAKQLAHYIFGGKDRMVRIDMSEFSEKFNISKLIGAPAGYIGYKEGNKLTDVIKNKPYSLILFDEIEKAHSDVFNLLLPILEEGELTDATGRTVNFKNCVIIMTSNIGLAEFNQEASLGFSIADDSSEAEKRQNNFKTLSQKIAGSLKDYFPPEFLNRLDHTIVFEPISKTAARQIIKQEIKELICRLQEQEVQIDLDYRIINQLLKSEKSIREGARSLKRLVDTHLTNNLAAAILDKSVKKIKVSLEKNKIIIK